MNCGQCLKPMERSFERTYPSGRMHTICLDCACAFDAGVSAGMKAEAEKQVAALQPDAGRVEKLEAFLDLVVRWEACDDGTDWELITKAIEDLTAARPSDAPPPHSEDKRYWRERARTAEARVAQLEAHIERCEAFGYPGEDAVKARAEKAEGEIAELKGRLEAARDELPKGWQEQVRALRADRYYWRERCVKLEPLREAFLGLTDRGWDKMIAILDNDLGTPSGDILRNARAALSACESPKAKVERLWRCEDCGKVFLKAEDLPDLFCDGNELAGATCGGRLVPFVREENP